MDKIKELETIIDICLFSFEQLNQTKVKKKAINAIMELFNRGVCKECGCNIGMNKEKLCFYCRMDEEGGY